MVVTTAGHRILRLGRLEFSSDAEHLLCSAALGVICLQALLFGAQVLGHIRAAVLIVLVLALLFGLPDLLTTLARVYGLVWRMKRGSRLEKSTIGVSAAVLLVGLLLAGLNWMITIP